MLIVIAFDDYDRNVCLFELSEHHHRVVSGLRIDVTAVEEVSGNDHKIDPAGEGGALDDLLPRAKKIARAVREIVPLDAQMNVGDVKKPGHRFD